MHLAWVQSFDLVRYLRGKDLCSSHKYTERDREGSGPVPLIADIDPYDDDRGEALLNATDRAEPEVEFSERKRRVGCLLLASGL